MCLAKVYMNKVGEQPVMEEISHLRVDGERIEMKTLFGEEKLIKGRVQEIDFMASKVILASDGT
jgi:predicted RNA-binding protein